MITISLTIKENKEGGIELKLQNPKYTKQTDKEELVCNTLAPDLNNYLSGLVKSNQEKKEEKE